MRDKYEIVSYPVSGWFVPELSSDYYVCDECAVEMIVDGEDCHPSDLYGSCHLERIPECESCGLASPPVSS